MTNPKNILGKLAKDLITGLFGTIIAVSFYLNDDNPIAYLEPNTNDTKKASGLI